MTNDEIEFLIVQHVDGTLSAADEPRLRELLAADATAQAMLAEHRALDAALKASKIDVPFDADWLAAQIAAGIDEDANRTFKLPTFGWAPLAAAAMLMISLTLGGLFLRNRGSGTTTIAAKPAPTPAAPAVLQVQAPTPERAMDGGYASVSVGSPANLTPTLITALFVADQSSVGRVSIQPAGRIRHGGFD